MSGGGGGFGIYGFEDLFLEYLRAMETEEVGNGRVYPLRLVGAFVVHPHEARLLEACYRTAGGVIK